MYCQAMRYPMDSTTTYEEIHPKVEPVRCIQVRTSSQPLGAKGHPTTEHAMKIYPGIMVESYPPYNSAVPSTTNQ